MELTIPCPSAPGQHLAAFASTTRRVGGKMKKKSSVAGSRKEARARDAVSALKELIVFLSSEFDVVEDGAVDAGA
jgi:hypothetical protein